MRLRVAIALSALALTLGLPFHASTLLAQYQPPSEKLLITAGSAATWAGDGEDVIQLEGPVTIETDRARLSAQRAVIWLRPAPQAGLPPGPGDRPAVPLGTQRAEILLIGDAQVEHAGALRTGPRMAVTAEVAGEVRITAQERRAIDLSNSPLYQQALELRRAALPAAGPASQPTAGPATRPAGTDEDAPPPPPKVEPVRLIFKQMDTQYVVDGKVAPLVTGGITLMQRRDNGDFIELQAERAVIFTTLDKPSDASRLGEAKNIEEAVSGVYLEGDVRIVFTPANPTTGEQRFRARRIFYDFTADRAVLTDAVIHTIEPEMQIPVVIRARMVRQLSLGEFKARNVELSTSSFALPSYSVAAESVYVRKVESTDPGLGDRLVFRADNATFRMFGVPVFWLPRAGGSLTDRGLPLRSAALQNSSTYGASVRTTWGLFETLGQPPPEDLDVEYALDYLGDRGIAGGIDADYEGGFVTETTRQRWAFEGELDSYFVNDRGIDTFGRLPTPVIDVNPDPAIEDLRVDRPDSEFRGQALWKHQHFFPGDWQLQVRAGYVSDPTFLETYFRRDFNQGDPHDVSFYLKRQRDTEAATFLTSVQPNNVVTTADLMQERFEVERLPEFGYRRIGDGFAADDGGPFRGMTLVSTNTVSGLRFNRSTASLRELGFSDTLGPGLPSLGRTGVTGDTTYRGDFRQEVSFPVSLGQFRFLPYLVGRYTGYSDAPGGGEEHRLYSAVGARVSTAFWKVDEGVESRMFDLHRMRHVVEPELNVYASGTNVDWSELFIYDEPVDSIHDVSAVSLALRQRWQTERGAPGRRRSVDFLALNVEGNFFANEDEDLLPPQQFRGLYFASLPEASVPRESVNADLTWRLGDTTVALADAQYNLDENELATLGVGMIVTRDERLSYFLSSRYINVTDSNVAGIAATYELSRKYTVIVSQSYDFGQSENVVSGIEVRRRFDTFFLSVAASQSKVDEESSFSINFYPTWLAVPALDAGQFRNVFGGPRRRR